MADREEEKELQEIQDKGITLVPVGGIACRIRTIASMIYLAEKYQRPLEILWHSGELMPLPTDRLFTLVPRLQGKRITVRQFKRRDHLINTPPMPQNLYLTFPFTSLRYDRVLSPKRVESLLGGQRHNLEEWIKDRDKSLLIATDQPLGKFDNMYEVLEPTVEVNNVLLSSMASWKGRVIGVHINRRINPQTTHNESPIELFIKRMQEMIEQDNDVEFFIATTSKDERERLAAIFRNRVYVPQTATDPHTLKGVIQSLGELLALSHTERILTTPGSNYSQVASEVGDIPLEPLSIYANK
ncbi:MAG: hypothetical protein Q4E10_02700 [Porphyromonas sp.]|nr:hypothetical protein [Porphyromonas sp.]